VAAVVVGVLSAFDLAGPTVGQLVLFSCLAVGSLLVFRARLLRWFQRDPQRPAVDPIIGAVAVVVDDLAPGAVGRAELRGASWSARNAASTALARGARCRVVRVEGLMLHVEPEGAHS
jgi:membrane protein implicated in regulation of membrane protease activity